MRRKNSIHRPLLPATGILILLCVMALAIIFIPIRASNLYGAPTSRVGLWGIVEYSARLLWYDGVLTRPLDPGGSERPFTIDTGEPVGSIAVRLESEGLIQNAAAFRDYVVYKGLDTSIQAGKYELSSSKSIVDIAHILQDATPEEVTFVVLPGWRAEEIASSLPTSGLSISYEQFMQAAGSHPTGFDFFSAGDSSEGFLYPDAYIFKRDAGADEVIDTMVRNFALHLSAEMREGFARQGLTVYQAVTLASLVEREAVDDAEKPTIASVFINRLNANMKLDSDPTVQFALGYNAVQQSWWTNPLSTQDLQVESPFNTYKYAGLPPAPISNPGESSLKAVAYPPQTNYYYFRARCDGSGEHLFAQTFDEHLANACP
jgi:UPF0755 protein